MRLGIFARTFERPTLGQVLDTITNHQLDCVQFNMTCARMPSMPDRIDPGTPGIIRDEMAARAITMAAVSGTYNMIHPDVHERRQGHQRLGTLASACTEMGTSIITLCTGTRDPEDKWRRHPDNDSTEAWQDLLTSMNEALGITRQFGITLAIEPEVSNVVDSAKKARLLLDEMQSSRLKIIMDPANLFHLGELSRMQEVLREAFDLLGEDIVIAHAKDLDRDGSAGEIAAGKGVLDYQAYLSLLTSSGFEGPLIMHGLQENEVGPSSSFLRRQITISDMAGDTGAAKRVC